MAKVMRNWLEADVENWLKKAQSCKFGGQGHVRLDDKTLIENDGSNIRIRLRVDAKPLQILEFLTFEDPIEARVSDSIVFIKARFTSTVAKKYEKQYRRRLTDRTKGGLIRMHDFEIVASHLAPKAEGVTLLIHDFNPISGCEGSPPFGKPEAITSVNGIRNALDGVRKVLANWEKHQPTAYTKEDDEKRSLPPAYEEDMLRGGSTNSQVRFATQAPVMNSAKIGRADKQIPTAIQLPPQRPAKKAEDISRLKNARGTKPSQNAALLGLISTKPKQSVHATTSKSHEQARKSDVLIAQKSDPHSGASISSPGKDVPLSRELKPLNSPQSTREPPKDGQTETLDDSPKSAVRRSVPAVDNAPSNGVAVEVKEQPVRESPAIAKKIPRNGTTIHRNSDESNRKTAVRESPWKGLEKIPRRQFIISKEQQQLLDHPQQSCWIPADPGRRPPLANIPLKILEAIGDEANDLANGAKDTLSAEVDPERASDTSPTLTQSSFAENKDTSDLPISSADWPASSPTRTPIKNQLPPDSSPGVRIDLEDEDFVECPRHSLNHLAVDNESMQDVGVEEPNPRLCEACGERYELESGPQHDCRMSENEDEGVTEGRVVSGATYTLPGDIHQIDPMLTQNGDSEQSLATTADQINAGTRSDYTKTIAEDRDADQSGDSELEEVEPQPFQARRISPTQRVPERSSPRLSTTMPSPATVFRNRPVFDIQVKRTPDLRGPRQSQSSPTKQVEEPPSKRRRTSLNGMPSSDDWVAGTMIDPEHDRNTQKAVVHNVMKPQEDIHGSDALMVESVNRRSNAKSYRDKILVPLHPPPENRGDGPILKETPPREDGGNEITGRVAENGEDQHVVKTETRQPDSNPLPSPSLLVEENDGSNNLGKRRREEISPPRKTRRVKVTKLPTDFGFGQDLSPPQDPAILKKKHREEILKSLKEAKSMDKVVQSVANTSPKPSDRHKAPEQLGAQSPEVSIRDAKATAQSIKTQQHEKANLESPPAKAPVVQSEDSILDNKAKKNAVDVFSPAVPSSAGPVVVTHLSENLPCEAHPRKLSLPKALVGQPITTKTPQTKPSLFDRFKQAYPEYDASESHFLAMCRKIDKLRGSLGIPHSLWDDFIIRHRVDYKAYLNQCNEGAENPIPYEKYYIEVIEDQETRKRIVTPTTLNEMLSLTATGAQGNSEERSSTPRLSNASNTTIPSRLLKDTVVDLTSDQEMPSPELPTLPKRSPSKRKTLPWLAQSTATSPPSNALKKKSTKNPIRNTSRPSTTVPLPRDIPVPPTPNLPPYPPHASRLDGPAKAPKSPKAPKAPAQRESSQTPALPNEWWKDPFNPFKNFTRAEASLRAGNGNSYAGGKSEDVKLNLVGEEKVLRAERKVIDVMKWEL